MGVWIASVLVLEYQLRNVIKGNQGDSLADKKFVKNLFRTRNSKLSNANARVHRKDNNLPIYYLAKTERAGPKALKMEGVRESLSSAQHDPEFASVRVVTSKTPGKQMWAEYQAIQR